MRHFNGKKMRSQGVSDKFPVDCWMESGHLDPWRGTTSWRSVEERERPAGYQKVWFGNSILLGNVEVLPASSVKTCDT